MFLNSSWIDPPNCQLTPETACDLSFDLGSDSDYNFRVRAHCGSQKSAWTRSSSPFNRRESEMKARSKTKIKASPKLLPPSFSLAALLTALLMKVTSEGDDLQVSFNQPPLNAVVTVTAWKRGEGPQVTFLPLNSFSGSSTLVSFSSCPPGGVHAATGADAAAHPRPAGGRHVLHQGARAAGDPQQQHGNAVCLCQPYR